MKAYFMQQGSNAVEATHQAYEALWGTLLQQAAMLSYNDTFLLLAFVFMAMFPFLLLLRRPKQKGGLMVH